jgi:acyl carrier protein
MSVSPAEVETGVLEALRETSKVDVSTVTSTSQFSELGLNLFEVVELMIICEDKFKVDLDKADIGKIASVSELVSALVTRLKAS